MASRVTYLRVSPIGDRERHYGRPDRESIVSKLIPKPKRESMTDDSIRRTETIREDMAPEWIAVNQAGEFSADYPNAEITSISVRKDRNEEGFIEWKVRIDGEA